MAHFAQFPVIFYRTPSAGIMSQTLSEGFRKVPLIDLCHSHLLLSNIKQHSTSFCMRKGAQCTLLNLCSDSPLMSTVIHPELSMEMKLRPLCTCFSSTLLELLHCYDKLNTPCICLKWESLRH